MSKTELDATLLTVGELFSNADVTYTVPVYQRNFAWRAEQIEQLISDVRDALEDGESGYFLGNLIVTERQSPHLDFEVIDGQQRLTTLFLLLTSLSEEGSASYDAHTDRLRYQSRPRATEALRRIATESSRHVGATSESASTEDTGIHQGFNVIRQYMDQHIQGTDRARFAHFLRTQVTVVRATLPPQTDLNRYFEVMNTRGQQLQQVDIVKARLMSYLADDMERSCFAWIWDACADMESYVQMSLTRGDTNFRREMFDDNWTWLNAASFAEVMDLHATQASILGSDSGLLPRSSSLSLEDALQNYATSHPAARSDDTDNVRFRSTIEFPSFLLHVLRVMALGDNEDEGQLDDKRLIKRFDEVLAAGGPDRVRDFAFELLRCRNIFDAFILKRQFTATNGEDGDWSLQRLLRRTSKGRSTPGYINLFSQGSPQVEEDGDVDPGTNDLLLIQSMLRVTYTSPRTMHWITNVLRIVVASGPERVSTEQLVAALREYSRRKVADAFFSDVEPTGFSISRIVFTYLDYLLVAEKPRSDFRFSYRNSIEHFYPQHPDEQQSGDHVSATSLHLLGNLALVSVGANSKFSNSLPMAKAENYASTIEAQSPKLHLMAGITRRDRAWGDAQVSEHHTEVLGILRRDLGI